MKLIIRTSASIALIALGTPLFAAPPPYEAEFNQLRDLHDKQLAAAEAPVNQLYRAALEQLLRRATKDNDTATASRIKFELQTLGGGGSPSLTAPSEYESPDVGKLREQLSDTEWRLDTEKTFILHADGLTSSSWTSRVGHWRVVAPDTIELSIWNVRKPLERATVDPAISFITWTNKAADEPYPRVAKRVPKSAPSPAPVASPTPEASPTPKRYIE